MIKTVVLLMCVGLVGVGCNKNKKEITNADKASRDATGDKDKPLSAAPAAEKTVKATGDIKDLLLALKRVHFGFDNSTLTSMARQALVEAAEKLEAIPDVALYVDGHTDERGTTEYNMSLGERRAQAVVRYLEREGVGAERLSVVSFGEESPLVNGAGEIPYAQNRRVEFRLMRGNVEFVLEESDLVDDEGNPIQNASLGDMSEEASGNDFEG